MIDVNVATPQLMRKLYVGTVICIFAILSIVISLTAIALIKYGQATVLDRKLAEHQVQMEGFRKIISKFSLIKPHVGPKIDSTQFQSLLGRFAKQNQCVLAEYVSAPDATDFVSKYDKTIDTKGWKQSNVQAKLVGDFASIFKTLSQVSTNPIPLEIDSIDLLRTRTDAVGTAEMTAQVSLRIIKQDKAI